MLSGGGGGSITLMDMKQQQNPPPQKGSVTVSAPLNTFNCDTFTSPELWFVGCRIQLFESGQLRREGVQVRAAVGGARPGKEREREREGESERERGRKRTETKDDCVKRNGSKQAQVKSVFWPDMEWKWCEQVQEDTGLHRSPSRWSFIVDLWTLTLLHLICCYAEAVKLPVIINSFIFKWA